MVSGAPGAGKSTFAAALADHMRLLHIERDMVFHGMQYTYGESRVDKMEKMPFFYDLLRFLLNANVSVVTDGTLHVGKSEADITPLLVLATVVNVHCRAENTQQRFRDREIARHGGEPEWLAPLLERIQATYAERSQPVDIDWPTIVVKTTAKYTPSVEEIARQIDEHVKAAQE